MREELPTDPGSVTIGVNKQYPTPFRSSVKIVAQEPVPGERGSVFSTASHQYPTPLRTPPRIASGVELQPEGGSVAYTHGQGHINVRAATPIVVMPPAPLPEPGGAAAHAGQPSSLPPFSQPPPRRQFIAQQEPPATFPGSVYTTHGPGVSSPVIEPARVIVTRAEMPTEGGRVFTHVNPAPILPVRPRPVIAGREDVPADGEHPGPAWEAGLAIAPFNRPNRPVIVRGMEIQPEIGRTTVYVNQTPYIAYAMTDPDLAFGLSGNDPGLAEVDPDLALEC